MKVKDVMHTEVEYVRRLLVIDSNGRLCGIVSWNDLVYRSPAGRLTEKAIDYVLEKTA